VKGGRWFRAPYTTVCAWRLRSGQIQPAGIRVRAEPFNRLPKIALLLDMADPGFGDHDICLSRAVAGQTAIFGSIGVFVAKPGGQFMLVLPAKFMVSRPRDLLTGLLLLTDRGRRRRLIDDVGGLRAKRQPDKHRKVIGPHVRQHFEGPQPEMM
jgi:hypothetical protein